MGVASGWGRLTLGDAAPGQEERSDSCAGRNEEEVGEGVGE